MDGKDKYYFRIVPVDNQSFLRNLSGWTYNEIRC